MFHQQHTMAEQHLKNEPEFSPEPSEVSARSASRPFETSPQFDFPQWPWQQCDGLPIHQQVKILEEAAKCSEAYFTAVREVLKQAVINVPECAKRVQDVSK